MDGVVEESLRSVTHTMQGLYEVLDHTPQEHHRLVRAIAVAVQEMGVAGLQSQLTDRAPGHTSVEQNAPGGLGRYGASASVLNIIPASSGSPAVCTPTVLAVASGAQSPGGWAMVLRLLRAHLIECSVGTKGLPKRTAIVVTDTFVRRAWYESQRDFMAHMQSNGLVFIGMHWNGRRWAYFKP